MELKILEETDKKLIFEVKGVDHTVANLINNEIWADSDIKASGYNISHPLVGIPKFIIETTSKKPRAVLTDAIKRVKKHNAEVLKAVSKL